MGRYSRSRKVQEKKRAKAAPPRERLEEEDDGSGGSLMSMRSGFKSIAGVSEEPAKSGTSSIIGWVVFALLAIALVMFFVAR